MDFFPKRRKSPVKETFEDRLAKIEMRINMLEERLAKNEILRDHIIFAPSSGYRQSRIEYDIARKNLGIPKRKSSRKSPRQTRKTK